MSEPDAAILRLVNFIRSCFENLGPVEKFDPLIVKQAIELYKMLLSQSGNNVGNMMIKKNTYIRSNFFVWINFLLMTTLSWEFIDETISGFSNYFNAATETIQDKSGRLLMRIEFLKAFSKKGIRSHVFVGDLLNILNNSLTDMQGITNNEISRKTTGQAFLDPIRAMVIII